MEFYLISTHSSSDTNNSSNKNLYNQDVLRLYSSVRQKATKTNLCSSSTLSCHTAR